MPARNFVWAHPSAPTQTIPVQLKIYSTDATQARKTQYTVSVTTSDYYSGLVDATRTFKIMFTCNPGVSSVAVTGTISDFTYYYGTGTVNKPFPVFTPTPNCGGFPLTYQLRMQDGSSVPSAFQLDVTNKMFQVINNVSIASGIYRLKLIATETWSDLNPKFNDQTLWSVTIACASSMNVVTNPIPASTTYILDPNFLNTQTLTLPTYSVNPGTCPFGPVYNVQLVSDLSCQPFITCTPTSVINIATTNYLLAGTYNFRIAVSDTMSQLTNTSVVFTVIVKVMNATSITMSTKPGNQVYLVGATMLQIDPATYTWYPWQSTTSFSYSVTAGPAFVTIGGSPQKIQVYTTSGSNTGTYSVTVKATETNSGLMNSQTFSLLVKCVQSIAPVGTLAAVNYYITDTAITRTPSYTLIPSDCPNELVMYVSLIDNSPLPTSITFSQPIISVYQTNYALTNYAGYQVKVTATDPKTGVTNSSTTFWVYVKCTKTISVATNPIPATTTYILDPNILATQTLSLPTFAQSPAQCNFQPNYNVKLVSDNSCQPFITCTPTSVISIATTNWTLEGTYNFRIDLTDNSSDVTNSSVLFAVVIQIKPASSITMATTPSNQVYSVNAAMLLVSLPTYTWYPTQSHTVFTYQITAGPAFVTLGGSPLKIQIYTTTGASTGNYSVTIKTTETNSGLNNSQSFNLLVQCVSSIIPAASIADVLYFITDPAITRTPAYILTPADCPNELVLTVTLTDNSPLPSSITYTAPTISVQTNTYSLATSYAVKIVATDPKTGLTNSALTFNVVIKCTKSITVSANLIPATTTYILNPNVLQTTTLTYPTFVNNPSGCPYGPVATVREVISTSCVSWVTCNPTSGTNVAIATTDWTLEGTYNFRIDLVDTQSDQTNSSVLFQVIIKIMNATSITMATTPGNQVYTVSAPMLQVALPTYTWFPTQSHTVFSSVITAGPTSFVSIAGSPLAIHIYTMTASDTGIYTVTIRTTETNSGLFNDQSFQLLVKCVLSIAPQAALTNVLYFITDPAITRTPAYNLTPSNCPYELVLIVTLSDGSPLPPSITYTAPTISVQTNTYALATSYTVKIVATDPKSGVTESSLTLNVVIKCTKSITVSANPIPATTTYTLDPNVLQTTTLTYPTFVNNPSGCPYGPVATVKEVISANCVSWVTCNPTSGTNVAIATTDWTLEGTYNFRIDLVDTQSDQTNSSVLFQVIIKIMNATSITMATTPGDQVYSVGSAILSVDLPTYTWFPTQSHTTFTFQLITAPSFVTLGGSPLQIHITTNNGSDTGIYPVTILTTETNSGLTNSQNFTLLVKCVQTITPVAALADVVYYITDTTITRSHAFTLFPADCTNELTYDVKLQNGDPLPPSITHAAPTISVFTSDFAVETSYIVKVVATDPKTGITNAETTLNVVIKCTKTIDLISGAITDFAYRIVLSSPFEMQIALPAYDVNPSGCPKQAFTFQMLYLDSLTFPAFITQVPTVDVRVLTQNVSFVGQHNFKLQVTEPLTGLFNEQDIFVCTILDANYATALNFVTEIADTAYLVNTPQIVLDAPIFAVTPTDADVSYSYSLVNAPLFVTLVPQGAGSSKISIVTTSSAHTGIYTIGYKITEGFSLISITDTFVLTVQCVTDIKQLSSVAPAAYYINDTAEDVQIPLYSLIPASCPYELTYSAALSNGDLLPHAITLQSSGSNFLRLLETDPTLIGVYQVRVTVTDPKTALVNSSLLIDVTILCTKQISLVTNLIPATSVYTINKSNLLTTVHPLPVYEPTPNNCNSLALSYQVELNPVSTFPGFITETPTSQIEIASTDPLDANVYNFRLVVTDTLTGLSNNVVLFEVDVVAISALTLNTVTAVADQVYKVNDAEIVLPVPLYSQTPAYAQTKFTYTLIAPTPYFVTLLGPGNETSNVQIVTASHVDTGTYTVTIQTFEEYSQITKTYSFQLLVTCVHSILTTSTISDVVYYIGDTQIQIPIPSYGLTPSECPIELFYNVKQSNGNPLPNAITVDQSTFGLETINIYETNQNVAALYTIQVKAVDTKTQIESDLITFQVTVRLRATGLVLIAGTEVADFTYLVGAAAAYLDVPEYEVLPVNANTNCLHALSPSTPAFVTIDGDPYGSPKIKIVSNNVLDTGIYSIDVTYTDTFSGIQKTDTFVLTVFCVSSIQQLNTVAPVVYFITDPTISVSLPAYSITPSDCPYEIQVTSVTLVDDSALPNAIVFDGVNTVHIQENTYTATGIYQVKVNVKDPKSLVTNSALIFNVTVKCTKSIDVVNVNLPASSPFEIDSKHLNTLPLTQPTFQPFPPQCTIGTYTYELADNLGTVLTVPPFITTFDNTSLIVATTDITFEGTYDFSIKVTESISSLVNNQVQFQLVFTVKVYATQMTVITATLIQDQNYLLGSPAMMLQVPEYDFVPTNSILNVVYSLVNPPPFVTIVDDAGTWVQVLTSDATNTNVYVIEVKTTDNESGLFKSQTFNLIVSCVRQINIPAALLDVEYFITDAAIERYPTFLLTPGDCPNELEYLVTRSDDLPLPGSITFNNNRVNPIISVQEQNYSLTAIYQVKVVVTDPKTSQQNSAYMFTVTVKCTKTIDVAAGPIADFSYRIDLDAPWTDSVPVPQYVPNPSQCLAGTYSLQVVLTDPGSFPVFINEFPTSNLVIATQDVSNVGVYNFKIRATESITGLVNDSNSFALTIQEPIYTQDLTLVAATAIADFTYWITEPEMQVDAPQYEVVPANADRQISYQLDPATPAFVTLIPTASGIPKVSVTSGSNADVGIHSVSIVTTEFWSNISKTFTFQLTVACIRNIQQLNVIAPTVYYIYDPAIELTVPVYSLTPATCLPNLSYSANQLNGNPLPHAISLVEQAGSQVITIDETNPLLTGVYTVVVQVVDSFSLNTNSQLQVQVTVKCTKSITLLDNPLLPLSFNVGTEVLSSVSLPLPTYWPFPSDCDFGPFSFKLVYVENPTGSFPPFIISQFPQTDIVVSTQSTTYLGDRHFQIIAKDQMTGLENNEVTELITLYCQVTKLTTDLKWFKNDIYYTPGAEPQSVIELPTYNTVPSRCIEPYTTEIFLQVTPDTLEPLPDWITLAADEKKFVIYSTDLNLSGVFEFKVRTTVAKYNVFNDELGFVIRLECRIKSILADIWISDFTYIIQSDRGVIEELALPGLIVDPDYCPQHFMFSVFTINSNVKAQSFVSVDGKKRVLQFQSRDISLLGSYQIRVVVLEPKYSVSLTIILNVNLDCIVTKIENVAKFSSLPKYQYTIGDVQKTIKLPDYDQYPAGCVKPLSFSLLLTEIDGLPITEDSKMPTFISLNSVSKEIVLFGLNMREGLKTYTFFLLASEPKSGVSESVPWSFMLDIQLNNKPPEFLYKVNNAVLTNEMLSAGNVRIKLPPIIDKEGNKIVLIQPTFKDAESFMTFDLEQLEFIIDSENAQLAEPKAYTISIRLVDEFFASGVATFVIELQPDKIQQRLKDIALKQTDILYFDDDIFYDLTMSDFVQEDQGQLVLQEFTKIIESVQNGFDISSSFTAKISPVAMDGNFKVEWSDEIFPMRKVNVIAKNVVAVRVIWMNESILKELEPQPTYKVKLVDLTHEYISFKLLFDDPSLISMGSMLDIVEVHFRNPDFFVRQKDFAKLSEKSRILIQQIPRQVELEEQISAVNKLVSAGKNTAGVGLGSMAVASLAGVSGVTFWGAFNTIQLITMQAYTGSQMPSNAANLFLAIDEFMRGSVANPGQYFQKFFVDKKSVSLPVQKRELTSEAMIKADQQVQQMVSDQYIPKSPVVEAGFFFTGIVLCIIFSAMFAIIESLINCCSCKNSFFVRRVFQPIKNFFMFKLMIYLQQFGYVYFVLSGIKQRTFEKSLIAYGSTLQVVNTTLFYLVFAYVTIYPLSVAIFFSIAGEKGLKNKITRGYFGALYSGIELSNPLNVHYVTLFLLRRFTIGVAIAFLRSYYNTQLIVLQLTSMLVLTVVVALKPYSNQLTNVVEIANESLLIVTIYLMHGFSFYIPSKVARFQLGWVYIGVVLLVFLINTGAVLQGIVRFALLKLRRQKPLVLSTRMNYRLQLIRAKRAETERKQKKASRFSRNTVAVEVVSENVPIASKLSLAEIQELPDEEQAAEQKSLLSFFKRKSKISPQLMNDTNEGDDLAKSRMSIETKTDNEGVQKTSTVHRESVVHRSFVAQVPETITGSVLSQDVSIGRQSAASVRNDVPITVQVESIDNSSSGASPSPISKPGKKLTKYESTLSKLCLMSSGNENSDDESKYEQINTEKRLRNADSELRLPDAEKPNQNKEQKKQKEGSKHLDWNVFEKEEPMTGKSIFEPGKYANPQGSVKGQYGWDVMTSNRKESEDQGGTTMRSNFSRQLRQIEQGLETPEHERELDNDFVAAAQKQTTALAKQANPKLPAKAKSLKMKRFFSNNSVASDQNDTEETKEKGWSDDQQAGKSSNRALTPVSEASIESFASGIVLRKPSKAVLQKYLSIGGLVEVQEESKCNSAGKWSSSDTLSSIEEAPEQDNRHLKSRVQSMQIKNDDVIESQQQSKANSSRAKNKQIKTEFFVATTEDSMSDTSISLKKASSKYLRSQEVELKKENQQTAINNLGLPHLTGKDKNNDEACSDSQIGSFRPSISRFNPSSESNNEDNRNQSLQVSNCEENYKTERQLKRKKSKLEEEKELFSSQYDTKMKVIEEPKVQRQIAPLQTAGGKGKMKDLINKVRQSSSSLADALKEFNQISENAPHAHKRIKLNVPIISKETGVVEEDQPKKIVNLKKKPLNLGEVVRQMTKLQVSSATVGEAMDEFIKSQAQIEDEFALFDRVTPDILPNKGADELRKKK